MPVHLELTLVRVLVAAVRSILIGGVKDGYDHLNADAGGCGRSLGMRG